MKKYTCSYCSSVVQDGDLNAHAEKHFLETRGTDASGNTIFSKINVDYIPVS